MKPHEYKQQDRVKHGTFGKGTVTGYWQGHVGYVVDFDDHPKHLFIEGADLTPLDEDAKPMARSGSTYPLRAPSAGTVTPIQPDGKTTKLDKGLAQGAAKWADKFEAAAKEVEACPPPPDVDPQLTKAMVDAYREQAKDLRKESAPKQPKQKQPKQPKKSKKELEADARRARLAAMLGDDEE